MARSVAAMYPALSCGRTAAGPDGIRGSRPYQGYALPCAGNWTGLIDPGPTGEPSDARLPSQAQGSLSLCASVRDVCSLYVACTLGMYPAWKVSFRTISAHAIRAFLLARATVATLTGRRVRRLPSQVDAG